MYSDGLPDDLEGYCATLRSNCTSSRRHLHAGALVLAVEVRDVLICSEQFSVFARRPGRQQKRKKTASTPSALSAAWSPISSIDTPQIGDTDCSIARTELSAHLVIMVRAYRTEEDAALGSDVCARYRRNVIPNAVNRDVESLWELVARMNN
eukprot:m51a1_g12651 hypothetical protein (152) ;mRNA; f:32-747